VITRAVLPGVTPTAPLAVESVSVESEKAPVVFAPIAPEAIIEFRFIKINIYTPQTPVNDILTSSTIG
jgi:hypothetical protein